jgi:hypothetical protein
VSGVGLEVYMLVVGGEIGSGGGVLSLGCGSSWNLSLNCVGGNAQKKLHVRIRAQFRSLRGSVLGRGGFGRSVGNLKKQIGSGHCCVSYRCENEKGGKK